MNRCEVCNELRVFERHDCDAALRRKQEAEARFQRYAAEQEERRWAEAEGRRRSAKALKVAMAVGAVAVAGFGLASLTGGSEDPGSKDTASSASADEYDYTPTPTPTPSAVTSTPASPASSAYADLLERLHSEAVATGYSGAVGQRMPPSIFEGFVGGMLYVCREVESGNTTWADELSRDISTGAPRSAANRFNAFLANEFCDEALAYN